MNHRTRTALALTVAGALLAGAAVIATTSPASAATVPTHATYPGCDQTMPLNDHWPLTSNGLDDIRSVNNLAYVQGYGPAPYVTFNGSSGRGVGGMLQKGTNINIGTRDFVLGWGERTNDGNSNSIQFGKSPGAGPSDPGFVKSGPAYARVVGTTGDVKIDALDVASLVDDTNHEYCLERVLGVIKWFVDGQLQGQSAVNVGSINLNAVDTPFMLFGKNQPTYDADDMCGVTRISSTNHAALIPPTRTCYIWDVQLGTRAALKGAALVDAATGRHPAWQVTAPR